MCNIVWLYHIHIHIRTYVCIPSWSINTKLTVFILFDCIFGFAFISLAFHFSTVLLDGGVFFRSPLAYIVFRLTTIWNPFLIYYWILHVDSNAIRVSIAVWAVHKDNFKWIGLATQLDFYNLLIFHFAKVLNHLNFELKWMKINVHSGWCAMIETIFAPKTALFLDLI